MMVTTMPVLAAMVMEEVQEWAGKNEKVRQHAERMRAMLNNQVKAADCQKPYKNKAGSGAPPWQALVCVHVIPLDEPDRFFYILCGCAVMPLAFCNSRT